MSHEPTEALKEKALAAERYVSVVRAFVIGLNVAVYLAFLDHPHPLRWLAYAIIAIAVPYAAFVVAYQPQRRFPVFLSAGFTSVMDGLLITAWLAATGGFSSPFYPLWYVSMAAIAFRYRFRTTMVVAACYIVAYVALLATLGQLAPHWLDVGVRSAYIVFVGMIGGYLSRETLVQTQAKIRMRELMVQARDAEERLRAREQDLRANVSVLHATLDSTADGILVVDRENRITSFNRRFAEMWRMPPDVLESRDDGRAIGFVLDQLTEPEAFVSKIRDLYAHPASESFDTLSFKDGRVFERYSKPQLLNGAPAGRVWSFRDVTDQRRAEAQALENLAKAKEVEHLRQLDLFKTQFINNVAHELGTPLTPIRIQLHLLRTGDAQTSPETRAKTLEMIERNMIRLQRLVDEMLDGARLQAGRFRVTRTSMDLSPVVLEMTELFLQPATDAGVTFQVTTQPDLWVQGDANRLTQVLYNLVSNAIKFTPAGGRVTVAAAREGTNAIVEVTDTGVGLTTGQVERLFRPFGQVHAGAGNSKGGTGLGLYISNAIVEAHGSRLECRSAGPGHGATFRFVLPIDQGPAADRVSVAVRSRRVT